MTFYHQLILTIADKKRFNELKLKKIIFGGERFPINSVKKILPYLKDTQIFNVSGPTECTCICSAHKVSINDVVIICTYGSYNESEAKLHEPTLVYFNKENKVTNVKNKIPEQRLKSI